MFSQAFVMHSVQVGGCVMSNASWVRSHGQKRGTWSWVGEVTWSLGEVPGQV